MRWERIGTAMPPRKKAIRRQGRHSLEFKMQVVQYALSLPEGNRIKPTCRQFQNIAPVQVRKWLRAYEHTSPLSAELGDEDDDEDGEDSGSDDDDEEEGATPASKRRRLASRMRSSMPNAFTSAACWYESWHWCPSLNCGRPSSSSAISRR